MYDKGIKKFPDYYELHFNKGITLAGMEKNDEALSCFEKASSLNPRHASSHNGIAKLSSAKNRKIPALMAHYRFLAQEPQGKRAEANLYFLQKILAGDNKKTGENSITVNINADLLKDKKGKIAENDFSTVELILALEGALDYDDKNAKETEVAKLMRKTKTLCGALQEGKKDGKGFYWENYAPYFIALNEKNLIETFAYIALASTDKPEIADWLDTHKAEIEKFYEWNKAVGKK